MFQKILDSIAFSVFAVILVGFDKFETSRYVYKIPFSPHPSANLLFILDKNVFRFGKDDLTHLL